MKKNLNYFNYEERNGLFLLAFLLLLFCTFIFLQKRILPKETSISIVHNEFIQGGDIASFNSTESDLPDATVELLKRQKLKVSTDSIPAQKLKPIRSKSKFVPEPKSQQTKSYFKEKQPVNQPAKKQTWSRSKNQAKVSINSTKTEEWEALYGIGPKYAARIIKYQKWLGGFDKKSQLKEVYGIHDTLFRQIEPFLIDSKPYEKLKINLGEAKDLARHPYLGWKEANAIIKYRKHHGNYKSIEDVKKVKVVSDEILLKIEPYIDFFESISTTSQT